SSVAEADAPLPLKHPASAMTNYSWLMDRQSGTHTSNQKGRDAQQMAARPVRTRIRDSALQAIRLAGGLDAVSGSRWRSRRLLILCYHGFAQDDEHRWDPALYVTRDHLESRLEFLAAS